MSDSEYEAFMEEEARLEDEFYLHVEARFDQLGIQTRRLTPQEWSVLEEAGA